MKLQLCCLVLLLVAAASAGWTQPFFDSRLSSRSDIQPTEFKSWNATLLDALDSNILMLSSNSVWVWANKQYKDKDQIIPSLISFDSSSGKVLIDIPIVQWGHKSGTQALGSVALDNGSIVVCIKNQEKGTALIQVSPDMKQVVWQFPLANPTMYLNNIGMIGYKNSVVFIDDFHFQLMRIEAGASEFTYSYEIFYMLLMESIPMSVITRVGDSRFAFSTYFTQYTKIDLETGNVQSSAGVAMEDPMRNIASALNGLDFYVAELFMEPNTHREPNNTRPGSDKVALVGFKISDSLYPTKVWEYDITTGSQPLHFIKC